jgi:hypothetical protein
MRERRDGSNADEKYNATLAGQALGKGEENRQEENFEGRPVFDCLLLDSVTNCRKCGKHFRWLQSSLLYSFNMFPRRMVEPAKVDAFVGQCRIH